MNNNKRILSKLEDITLKSLTALVERRGKKKDKKVGMKGTMKTKTAKQLHRKWRLVAALYAFCKRLPQGSFITERALFYHLKSAFPAQRSMDATLMSLASALSCPRHTLGVIPNTRGLVAGLVQFTVWGRTWDCMASGTAPIPAEVVCAASAPAVRPSSFGVRPRCVLVVEKEAVFGRLAAAGLPSRVPSVLVTGRGYPDHATRAFAGALCRAFDVPAFGLCDCDPDGLRILLCYARGTRGARALGYADDALPALRWLGLRPSSHRAPLQPLSPHDRATLRGILSMGGEDGGGGGGGEGRSVLSHRAVEEARRMAEQSGGGKAELEMLGDDLPSGVEAMLLGRDWIPLLRGGEM